ncbi:MAG: S8 family serine peptidase [Candidatus Bathyarchaeia archaeon]
MASSRRIHYERLYIPHVWIGEGVSMGWHADDAAWQYPLPFNFSFYGVNYSNIFVSSNGLITFTAPDTSYSNSISTLASKLAIAPAWDDWVTEDPFDIFVWKNSTHVGIRWYTRAWGASTIANFEAILKIGGEIQFNYGFNNGSVSATIGISDGAGNILAEDVTSLNYTNSIIFRPYIPEHDLSVSLTSPRIVKLDGTVSLNATVVNEGLSNETDVNLMLIVNGSTAYSIVVPELLAGESYTLHYVWSPTVEGVYNITAFVLPTAGEEFIENNFSTQFVEVTTGYLPTDPMYFLQWHLRQIGCHKAWEITMGSPNVIVAMIDTGVDYDHPDLYANIWTNNYEIPYNGVDDDGNGYVDDWIGWDFADEDNDPMDCDGHGTHCAGIVAAMMDNGVGGCGVAPNVKIMTVKIFKPAPCAVATTVRENVTDPDNTLALLRKFRDGFLKTKYVKLYYEYSPDIVKILLEEPQILYNAARLIEKYTPAIKYVVEGKGEDMLMTADNIDEILSFTRRLKWKVNERRESIGEERSLKMIGMLEEFEEQVRASEGKTFSEAFQGSIYYGRNIRAFMARVETTDAWVIKGIKYAADNGAHVISMSFGGYESETGPKPDIEDACEYAYNKGCVLVAAAGNDAKREVCYPAKYNSVIAVSAIGYNSLYSWYTNYGPEIELCAPGGSDLNGDGDTDDENEYVYSTVWDDTYGGPGWVGTSMATPHVSGVAALIKSIHPDWSNEQIRYILELSAIDLGLPGKDEIYGYGRVNACLAITSQLPEHDLSIRMYVPHLLSRGESVLLNLTVYNNGLSDETDVEVLLLIEGVVMNYVLIPELLSGASYTFNYYWTPTIGGVNYNITAYVLPVAGEVNILNNRVKKLVHVSFYKRTYLTHQWISYGAAMGWHADDGWWQYDLPFNFPFYGVNYRTIYISSNGLITFTSPDTSWSNSISALANKLAIAPAWDDWVTDQPYDIYVWQNLTCVVIQWYVRAYGSGYVANFEAVLYINGTIQFNYAYNDGPVSATVGVSNGAGDILAEDVTNLNYINTIVFTPSLPEHDLAVTLEAPSFLWCGESTLLNAAVVNCGLNNETNVELQLLINGTVVKSALISELLTGTSYILTHHWAPNVGAMYNVTAYASPVLGEEFTANNIITRMVHVRVMPPLSVSITPLSALIIIGQSVTFSSTVSGGIPPYYYQWYLNNSFVSALHAWTFTPTKVGVYEVYLMITDSVRNIAISEKAIVTVAPQLTVSISPASASIFVRQSVIFTSTVSGGYPPYTYQWYLNGAPVSGATSTTWTFTPTTAGIYYVQLKVTDSKGNTAQSDPARITVATVPVGGYSIPIHTPSTAKQLTPYIILTTALAIAYTTIKHKTKKKNKHKTKHTILSTANNEA